MIKPTNEQVQAIHLARQGGSMVVIALAGAGKTSTLYMIAKSLEEKGKKGLYLAFNKGIATSAKNKMPKNVVAKTFHSLAYNATPKGIVKRLTIKESANDFITRHGLTDISGVEVHIPSTTGYTVKKKTLSAYRIRFIILEAIKQYCRSSAIVFEDAPTYLTLKKHEPLIVPLHRLLLCERLRPIIQDILTDYFSEYGEYPLNENHDVYLKHWAMSNPVIEEDFIMFDEAQDADPLMRQILDKQKCQVIYVGDPYQQIYSWRGAVNAMQNINAEKTYLTKSFRFGQALADVAQEVLDYLGTEVTLKGMDGVNTLIDYTTKEQQADFNAFICRTNAGVIDAAFWHIMAGKKFAVHKYDFQELIDVITGLNALECGQKSKHNMLKDFSSLEDVDDFIAATPGEMLVSPYRKLHKRYGGTDIIEMVNKLKEMKIDADTVVGITAHSAKGLEFDKICLSEDFVQMFFKADEETDKLYLRDNVDEEEFRLLYVAITRGKSAAYLGGVKIILDNLTNFKLLKVNEDASQNNDGENKLPIEAVQTTFKTATPPPVKVNKDYDWLNF